MGKKVHRDAAYDLLDNLRGASAALESCEPKDVGTKAGIVREALAQVTAMQLHRHCQDVEKQRNRLSKAATILLKRRVA